MKRADNHSPKRHDLHGLNGISDRAIDMHMKLYQSHMKETNYLTRLLLDFLKDGQIDQEEMPAYSKLKRRLGLE